MQQLDIVLKDPDIAFMDAIKAMRLSGTEGTYNYAGKYMYMGTYEGKDQFKNITTRKYLN